MTRRAFFSSKRAYYSSCALGMLFFISLFSEILCNDKPIVIHYQKRWYFPVFKQYTEVDFGFDFDSDADYQDHEFIAELAYDRDTTIIWPVVRFSETTIDFNLNQPAPSRPDSRHWLGTDDRARDVFARLLYGFRLSMVFGLALALVATFLGIFFGMIQAYFGGLIDLFGQRLTEIWASLPELFILLIVSSLFSPSIYVIFFIMAIMGWVGLSAYIRAEVLAVKQYDFVQGAVSSGAHSLRIMFKHILPNALASTLTFFPFRVSAAITSLASLDFLGLGVPSDTASLGELLWQGKSNLNSWWIMLSTFLTLSAMILALNFMGEGLRMAFDPKAKSKL